ncbi:hypothetical protein NLO90_26695, partial [Escherichia coli]|nr:hypothetical protein [Escherichia coli]
MGSCAAPSAKGDDKFITTDYLQQCLFLCTENPQLGRGFRKAFSFEPVIKTPFDLLKHLAVWQLQVSNKKSKGGPNGER